MSRKFKNSQIHILVVVVLIVSLLYFGLFSSNGLYTSFSKKINTQSHTSKSIDISKGNIFTGINSNSTSSGILATTTPEVPKIAKVYESTSNYVEVSDSCGPYYGGTCLAVRSGPGTEFEKIMSLRTGMVLTIDKKIETASSTWYKIGFDEWVRYPERMKGDWYINADYVTVTVAKKSSKSVGLIEGVTKRIVVDRSEQMLYAYDGSTLFMKSSVSTGRDGTLTPRGNFSIFKKIPSRYMQGPLPGISQQVYDLPGVPWTMYFTEQGGAFHGAYWHDKFGQEWSHGCVNLPLKEAKKLYEWADIGTKVLVRD